MAQEIYVAHREGIGVYSMEKGKLRAAAFDRAGALCVSGRHVFCAVDEGRAILRLNRDTLTPEAVFCGGPGIRQMLTSADGRRLYALCADADSVLMLDAASGAPMIVCRAGCNPQQMALRGGVLAVAGGESGCVYLLDAYTLEVRESLPMLGPVYSVDVYGHSVYALCLTSSLDAMLVTEAPGGRMQLAMGGMPGCVLRHEKRLLVSVCGRLYGVSFDGGCILRASAAPGRLGKLLAAQEALLCVDMLSERLFACGRGDIWRLFCAGVIDAAVSYADDTPEQKNEE